MPTDVLTATPNATPSAGTADSRANAFLAKMAGSQPQPAAAPVADDGDAGLDAGDVDAPEIAEPAPLERPKTQGLRGKLAPAEEEGDEGGEEDDGEPAPAAASKAPPDLDRIAKLERDARAKSRAVIAREREARTLLQQVQQEREQFARERQTFLEQQKALQTPDGVLEFFERNGGHGEAIRDYIIEANDPQKKAQLEARRAMSPIEAELKKVQAQLAQMAQEKAASAAVSAFTARISEVADNPDHASSVTFVARLHRADPDELIARADRVALEFNERGLQVDRDDVIIELERRLKREHQRLSGEPEPRARPGMKRPADTEEPDEPTPNRARAPAKPLNQRNASGRTVVVTPQGAVTMSMKERIDAAERRRMGR